MSDEPEFFYDIEQGSAAWFEIRRGLPTASEFQTILSNGKGRENYMRKLAGELLSDQPMESFQSAAMARGKEMEAEARERYCRTRFVDPCLVGFVRRKLSSGRFVGCSPDSLFTAMSGVFAPNGDTVLEIKTQRPDLMILARENGYDPHRLPEEHQAQCMGALWVTGLPRVELSIWYRGMPYSLDYSVPRDDKYIANLEAEVERFDRELHALVKRHKGYK